MYLTLFMQIPDVLQTIFEPELLKEIEQKAKLMTIPEGTTILEIGQTVRIMPIVLSGTCLLYTSMLFRPGSILKNRPIMLMNLKPVASCVCGQIFYYR